MFRIEIIDCISLTDLISVAIIAQVAATAVPIQLKHKK